LPLFKIVPEALNLEATIDKIKRSSDGTEVLAMELA
jgi:hypothetical protein